MKDWWFHSKLKKNMNFENNSMLCYYCFNTSVCILIESDNILRAWPLETEYFKLGIIHTTYFICFICICIPGISYSHWSTVSSLLSNTVTFIIKPKALGHYMAVVGQQSSKSEHNGQMVSPWRHLSCSRRQQTCSSISLHSDKQHGKIKKTQQKLDFRNWNARECSQIRCYLVLQQYQSLNLHNLEIKNHTVNSIKTRKTAGK